MSNGAGPDRPATDAGGRLGPVFWDWETVLQTAPRTSAMILATSGPSSSRSRRSRSSSSKGWGAATTAGGAISAGGAGVARA